MELPVEGYPISDEAVTGWFLQRYRRLPSAPEVGCILDMMAQREATPPIEGPLPESVTSSGAVALPAAADGGDMAHIRQHMLFVGAGLLAGIGVLALLIAGGDWILHREGVRQAVRSQPAIVAENGKVPSAGPQILSMVPATEVGPPATPSEPPPKLAMTRTGGASQAASPAAEPPPSGQPNAASPEAAQPPFAQRPTARTASAGQPPDPAQSGVDQKSSAPSDLSVPRGALAGSPAAQAQHAELPPSGLSEGSSATAGRSEQTTPRAPPAGTPVLQSTPADQQNGVAQPGTTSLLPAPSGQTSDAMRTQPTSPPVLTIGPDKVVRVQNALRSRGLYRGPMDGLIGPKTEAALRAFQRSAGLSENGRIDTATLERLLGGPA
jgi:hypothetical protein